MSGATACGDARGTEQQVHTLVTQPDGRELRVPAFSAGAGQWRVRYASGILGSHTYRTVCSDRVNAGPHAVEGAIEVVPDRPRLWSDEFRAPKLPSPQDEVLVLERISP